MSRREDSFSIVINAGFVVSAVASAAAYGAASAAASAAAASAAAASAVATDVYESAPAVTYQQLDDATEPARRLASAIGSSATNIVGTVYAYTFVAPILACNNRIQELGTSIGTSLEASLAPHRLEYAISKGDDIYHAKHTSDVMESLKKYKGGSRLEVKTFADFVAQDIIDELIKSNEDNKLKNTNGRKLGKLMRYEDLLLPCCIDRLSMLQSTAIHTSKMGLLNIDRLKEEFKNQYKGNEKLLKTIPKEKYKRPPELPTTIPGEAVSPNTTISGGFSALFSCCSARDKPKIQIKNTNTPRR